MGDGGGLGTAGRAELAEDVGHVHAGRLRRDEQHGGDLPVAAARGDEPEHLAFPAGQRREPRAVRRVVGRRADPRPAAQVRQRPAQRPGPQAVRRLRGQPPLLFCLVPAARLGQRLGQPPLGAGYLIDVGGTERVQDRLPGPRVVAASGPLVFRLGARQPAAALGAQDELGPLGERRPLPGDAQQFFRRGQLRAGELVIASGPGFRGPVGSRAQRDCGRPDDRRCRSPTAGRCRSRSRSGPRPAPGPCRPATGHARRAGRAR